MSSTPDCPNCNIDLLNLLVAYSPSYIYEYVRMRTSFFFRNCTHFYAGNYFKNGSVFRADPFIALQLTADTIYQYLWYTAVAAAAAATAGAATAVPHTSTSGTRQWQPQQCFRCTAVDTFFVVFRRFRCTVVDILFKVFRLTPPTFSGATNLNNVWGYSCRTL